MVKDKNAEKRDELTRAIQKLEYQEEEFSSLKKRFEQSLEDFFYQFRQLSKREEQLIHASHENHGRQQAIDIENHNRLNLLMRQYVDGNMSQLSDVQKQLRRSMDDQREQLLKERNELPWD